ncbi:hypothetical protein PIB30_025380 [Stylosanthes scabra]|uniref:Uncharacterized protein n=1 Tax=Stylosanthes scabra TaxID=79078 RepID=A0ABU6Z7R1_9FABA|nr:hypothetical protein [Stylosanthes scabra]
MSEKGESGGVPVSTTVIHGERTDNAGGRNKGESVDRLLLVFRRGPWGEFICDDIPSVDFTQEVHEVLSEPFNDYIVLKVLRKNFGYIALVQKVAGCVPDAPARVGMLSSS